MRRTVFILLSVLQLGCFAQTPSSVFDSQSTAMVQKLPAAKDLKPLLLKMRDACGIPKRLDDMTYEFAVIMEMYDVQDSSAEFYELYFNASGECLEYYEDGSSANEGSACGEGELSFTYWQRYHRKHRKFQKSRYFCLLSRIHDRHCKPVKKLKQETREYEKNHYTILTLLHKGDPKPQMTIIYPRKRILILTYYKGGGKC